MTRTLLTAALIIGLSGTVLAVPDLPAAPMPRAAAPKFTAPKLANGFDVVVYTTQRPVRIRLSVLVEGQTLDERWRERMQKLFDFCDRDTDGFLSETEIKYVYQDAGFAQMLSSGFFQPGTANSARLADFDKDGDGKVSFEEFIASYPRTASQVLRAQPPLQDFNNNTAVTEALFKLFDQNGDGKLTKNEVTSVEKLIDTRDADEDECLSIAELAPELFDQRFGQPIVRPRPNPATPAPGTDNVVSIYSIDTIPGLVTQQVIRIYDKNGDFDLAQDEIGFDDATFKKLDTNRDGKLDGDELDAWRTGTPDIELSLSMGAKPAENIAKIENEREAAERGFRLKNVDGYRIVLHVGNQLIDVSIYIPLRQQFVQQPLKQQYGYLFNQAAGQKRVIEEKDLNGPNAAQFQFLRVVFDAVDRDGDGKITKEEFDGYFDLQDSFRSMSLSLTPGVQTPSLFQLLDENRDGRLSVRELRTAWNRLLTLEEADAKVVTKNIIQPTVSLRMSRTAERLYMNQQAGGYVNPNQQVVVPSKGPLWFRKMDRNGDGDVSRREFVGNKEEFDAIDTDADGLISLAEAEAWDKKMREKVKEKDTPQPEK